MILRKEIDELSRKKFSGELTPDDEDRLAEIDEIYFDSLRLPYGTNKVIEVEGE